MVQFLLDTILDGAVFRPNMQKGSSKPGQGITVSGSITTQPQLKASFNKQDRGSCSSISSCPVFLAWQSDPEEDPLPHCSSSLSSPILQESLINLHYQSAPGSIFSHKESAVGLKSSVSSIQNSQRFPSSSILKSPKPSLCSVATSLHSSSTSFRRSSSSLQSRSSNEDDSWDTNSWSSGATCLLQSSIKQHSEEVFRVRASSGNRPKPASDSQAGHQSLDRQHSERKSESQKTSEKRPMEYKSNLQRQNTNQYSTAVSAHFEEKIEAKLKFSQFLNEVTCRVLDPESLQAFGLMCQKEASVPILPLSLANFSHSSPLSSQQSTLSSSRISLNDDPSPSCWASKKNNTVPPVTQGKECKVLDPTETLNRAHKKTLFIEQQRKKDCVWRDDESNSIENRNRKKEWQKEQARARRTLLVSSDLLQTNSAGRKHPRVVSVKDDSILRKPRTVNSNLVSIFKTPSI